MLILNESVLGDVLRMNEVIPAVEEGFRALAQGYVSMPERLRLIIPNNNAVMLEMPAYCRMPGSIDASTARNALGTKIVSVFEQNPRLNLDIVQSVYILLDAETGVPIS